ncbi:MAG: Rrf2 family transcriptional regulator [Halobacteriaceae archaeon]
MAAIELTQSQQRTLRALLNLYRREEDAVKGERIAAQVDRKPGTVRNQMQSLKALGLVEGVPGPNGGYEPTGSAYETLDVQELDAPAEVPLVRNGEPVDSVNVSEISLTSVHHPDLCRAEVHLRGSVRNFHEGDRVRVGPTPLADLVVEGTLDGRDDTNDVLVLGIESMSAPADADAE